MIFSFIAWTELLLVCVKTLFPVLFYTSSFDFFTQQFSYFQDKKNYGNTQGNTENSKMVIPKVIPTVILIFAVSLQNPDQTC